MKKKNDGREWLYVLEVGPSGRIKVGRTTDVRARLATHTATADFGGSEIVQTYTVICPYSRTAEFELIARVVACPGATVVSGREMFSGVPFRTAVRFAESLAQERRRKVQTDAVALTGSLLADCIAVFATDDRLHLEELRVRLAAAHPEMYTNLATLTLGAALRDVGIRTRDVRIGHSVRKGMSVADFHALQPGEISSAG